MCTVSVVSISASALYIPTDKTVTPYTISFESASVKYHLWQEATDYFGLEDLKIYISEPIEYEWHGEDEFKYLIGSTYYKVLGSYHQIYYRVATDEWCDTCEVCPLIFGGYELNNEDNVAVLENYLSDNDIEYTSEVIEEFGTKDSYTAVYPKLMVTDLYDRMQMLIDIKEDTDYVCDWAMQESMINVTDVVNTLPEPMLSGYTDCDGKVNINDAILVIQSIANPDKYQISWQGKR
ncbi:MAG: hypothetical protein K2O29_06035 [Ruminococcus sp.]|nr:hypothetical protein [Ruminococcus sp.]